MGIQRLDVFFRTQLILDKPQFFNSITNLALAPLQRLIGQNQFESLNGKVSFIPPQSQDSVDPLLSYGQMSGNTDPDVSVTPFDQSENEEEYEDISVSAFGALTLSQQTSVPPSYIGTLFKVVVFVCDFFVAIVLTPIGIAARCMSFRSPQTDLAFSHASFLQLESRACFAGMAAYLNLEANAEFAEEYLREVTESEYCTLMPHLSLELIVIYKAQKPEKEKKQALDAYLTTAIESLEKLKAGLEAKESQDEFRNGPLYPFPFYLAQALENNSKIAARADKVLWESFQSLKLSCLNFLSPDCDDVPLQTAQAQAMKSVTAFFRPNVGFFKNLKEKLESTMETSEIKNWIEEQKRATNYSYPFYTHPIVLKFMNQTAKEPGKLQPISEVHSTCLSLLLEKGLKEYLDEKPNADHIAVNAFIQANNQLENISKLQNLIKNQTT